MSIVTPLNIDKYAELLKQANYDSEETKFLVDVVSQMVLTLVIVATK